MAPQQGSRPAAKAQPAAKLGRPWPDSTNPLSVRITRRHQAASRGRGPVAAWHSSSPKAAAPLFAQFEPLCFKYCTKYIFRLLLLDGLLPILPPQATHAQSLPLQSRHQHAAPSCKSTLSYWPQRAGTGGSTGCPAPWCHSRRQRRHQRYKQLPPRCSCCTQPWHRNQSTERRGIRSSSSSSRWPSTGRCQCSTHTRPCRHQPAPPGAGH